MNGSTESSVVYFLRSGQTGPVKIGIAADLKKRVAELACGMPDDPVVLGTLIGSRKAESALHQAFRAFRKRGEWFEATDELLDLIRANNGRGADTALAWLRQHPGGRLDFAAAKGSRCSLAAVSRAGEQRSACMWSALSSLPCKTPASRLSFASHQGISTTVG